MELLLARLPGPTRDGDPTAEQLAALCGDEDANVQVGASWLLRARLEHGAGGAADAVVRVLGERLPAIRAAWARQHVCQCVATLKVPRRAAARWAGFLRAAAEDEPKFLRAWGLDGFVRLSWQHAEFAAEAEERLAAAGDDDAASVRARARNLRKEIARRAR